MKTSLMTITIITPVSFTLIISFTVRNAFFAPRAGNLCADKQALPKSEQALRTDSHSHPPPPFIWRRLRLKAGKGVGKRYGGKRSRSALIGDCGHGGKLEAV